jgi:hypothetical protein
MLILEPGVLVTVAGVFISILVYTVPPNDGVIDEMLCPLAKNVATDKPSPTLNGVVVSNVVYVVFKIKKSVRVLLNALAYPVIPTGLATA